VSDLGDWVRASHNAETGHRVSIDGNPFAQDFETGEQYITRRFSPDMSVATVRKLSGEWHEAVALSNPKNNVTLPVPWRDAEMVGALSIVPLDTAAAIVSEGRTMHHCAATLIDKVRLGESYLFGARDGEAHVATVEVRRANGHGVTIAQMRGPYNAVLPKPVQAQLTRWVRQRDKWQLPASAVAFEPNPFLRAVIPAARVEEFADEHIPF
jgi:hypothetical protein